MTDRNSKAINETASAAEHGVGVGDAPILLIGCDLEIIAAAGGKAGGVVGSRNHPSAS